MIVSGRGFDDLGGMIGVGFDLDDETNPGIQVVRSKRRQVFADVSHHPHFASQLHGGGRIRGWICAPMIIGDRVIGVLSVDKFEPDFYTEELAELATAFAAQAAMAIENARLLETERAAREQAETLRAAAESLGSTLDLPEVFDLILHGAAQGGALSSCHRPAARRLRDGDRRRPGLSEPRRTARTALRLAGTRRSCPRDGRAARAGHRSRRLRAVRALQGGGPRRRTCQVIHGRAAADRRSPDRDADARLVRGRLLHR